MLYVADSEICPTACRGVVDLARLSPCVRGHSPLRKKFFDFDVKPRFYLPKRIRNNLLCLRILEDLESALRYKHNVLKVVHPARFLFIFAFAMLTIFSSSAAKNLGT